MFRQYLSCSLAESNFKTMHESSTSEHAPTTLVCELFTCKSSFPWHWFQTLLNGFTTCVQHGARSLIFQNGSNQSWANISQSMH